MRGVLVQLTVGGYLHEQPGFITSLNYDLSFEAPWEVGIGDGEGDGIAGNDSTVKELPHMIKVTGFSFTPIHRFVPQLQKNTYSSDASGGVNNNKGPVNGFGSQRYIALEAVNNNYGPTTTPTNDTTIAVPPTPTPETTFTTESPDWGNYAWD